MKGRRIRVVLAVLTVLGLLGLAAPAPAALAQGAWYGEYFANPNLSGGPTFTRYDNNLRFDWGGGSPGGGIPADNFSVRWTREEWFEAGTYRFSYRSDDGIRIWIDGTLVVNDWRDRQAAWSEADQYVGRGNHSVRVEYYEHTGAARVEVSWEKITSAVWRAEYFDNRKLSGDPDLVRNDQAIDFAWKEGSPDAKLPADDFSVRWTQTLGFTAGTYRFYASCDDGVRIFVDGNRVVDAWQDQKLPNTRTGDITLGEGQHTVVVEYYEHGGEASAHVWWNRLGAYAGWEGRYYDNADLRGGPALVRDDAQINFDWGEGAPADWMPDDNFSAVWTRSVTFSPGTYRFNVRSDDGVRVWLDDGLVLDYWEPMDYEYRYVDGITLAGTHRLKVAYFERTGLARIHFWWEAVGVAPAPAVPTPAPTPAPVPAPVTAQLGPWQGEYFNNAQLSGTPALVRTDAALDFDWGWSAPAVGINRDNFSARWTGTFSFQGGHYRFTTTSDDGVRVSVDGQRVIDAWMPMRGTRAGEITLSGGNHTVQVEYFERLQAAMMRLNVQRLGDGAAAPPSPAPATPAPPSVCEGGPLRLDAWPIDRVCTASGWKATIYVRGHGGDCMYTYAWEREVKGGPTSGPMTFELRTTGGPMVGEASVTSAGQTAKVGLFIHRPDCD
jgi:hypothetical protein